MLKKAYDLGINFFETGDMYGKGKSEKLIGEVFKDMRDEVVLSTKYGYDFSEVEQIGHSELPQKFDEGFTRKALRNSLERLQTDHLDMYGLHNPKLNHIIIPPRCSIHSMLPEIILTEGKVGVNLNQPFSILCS